MIRVLNIISDSNIGGAGRCLINYIKYSDNKNFDISVVVPKGSCLKEEIRALGGRVIEADIAPDKSFDIDSVSKLKKIIKAENPDIVHTHGALSGRIAAKLCGKKIVYTRHSVFPVSPKIKKGIGRYLNKTINEYFSNDIIAVAEAAKENLTEGGINPGKIKVILNGVEKVEKSCNEECAAIKEKYGIKDEFVIGIMARIEEIKGHINLLEAAKILVDEGRKIKVLIIGEGSFEEKVRQKAKELGIDDVVIFTGFIPNVKCILSIIDVQANASFGTEATSLALLEGMSMGIPAVVSNYGGNPQVITNGENGYVFKLKDSVDMAKHIAILMDNKEKLEYMREKSAEIFEKKFRADIYARNIEKVYKDLMTSERCI
ncbi:MAG: glycosyltransferase [Lachnospiraceae bacterium]|nr:glycosyltransferase [Lachnospiraceae bacterium]